MNIVDDGCGRYTLHQEPKSLAKRFNVAKAPDGIRDNYNVAPGQIMPVITADDSGKNHMEFMRWGLIPVWAKDPSIGYRLINARDDTIFEKPMWRGIIRKKRALIPADGFYEWQKPAEGTKDPKQPYYIQPKKEGVFAFAGIWEIWHDGEGKEWKTYSIVTTEPNKEMRPVHNRMPVILQPEDEAPWLDSANSERQDIEPFLHPSHDGSLQLHKVSSEVNSASNNNKGLIRVLA